MNEVPRLTAYVVPHTHWDREWYQPLEVFRTRLVDVVDRVLELLELPEDDYRRFTLDGQAVVLDDYVAVRPERQAALAERVREGRLRIGPWYVLADEFLVSPEALVRNLEIGRRVCEPYGGAMPVAYTPDSFGHIGQLPLLVDGFGLKAVVFERGVGDEGERLGSEFRWLAADGRTEAFAVHLIGTYSAATALGHLDWSYRDAFDRRRVVEQLRAALFGPSAGEAAFPTWLRDALERLPQGVAAYTRSGAVLLLNGSDHLFPQTNVGEALEIANAEIEGVRFVHADVEEFIDAPRPALETLPEHRGEFRSSRYHHVLSGVWSTRMPLKQANHASETLLERYAEPLLAAASVVGGHDDRALLTHAWRSLLLNHPHDSICGCSIDAVHREMHARFDAVVGLGEELCARAVETITADAGPSTLAVFEPLPQGRWSVVHGVLDVPAGLGDAMEMAGPDGRALPLQRRVARVPAPGRSDDEIDRVTYAVAVPTHALGLTPVRWRAGDAGSATVADADNRPADTVAATRTGAGWLVENEALRLTVADDGSATLLDRVSGRERALRLRFEDQGDAGDEYDFSPIPGDVPREAAAAVAAPVLVDGGPLRAEIAYDVELDLPAGLEDDRRTRSGHVTLRARVSLAMEAFAEHVEVTVDLDNVASDHRLRLVVSSGVASEEIACDGHWNVVRRPVRPPEAPHWYQRPVTTMHQRRFSAVSDGEHGLAVLVRGLPEVEALPTEGGLDLAVTLLRSVGWLSRDDLLSRPQGAGPALPTPEAQGLGRHHFELAICAFEGGVDAPRLQRAAERFTAPPRAFAAGPREPRPDLAPDGTTSHAADGTAPPPTWSLTLTAPLTLSALRPAESGNGAIVRFWNPTTDPTHGRLELGADAPDLRAVHRVRLDETRLEELTSDATGIEVEVGPSEVVTLELTFAPHAGREGGGAMT